jgi:hypothetical protein
LSPNRIPLLLGNAIEILGIAVAISVIVVAPDISSLPLRFLTYLFAWVCLLFFPHCLSHYVTGRLVGVRFTHYLVSNSPVAKLGLPVISRVTAKIPMLGVRADQRSLKLVSRGVRVVMFTSGAAASMIFPFFAAVASLGRLPSLLSGLLLLLSVGNVAFDLYYSPRAGDISRI